MLPLLPLMLVCSVAQIFAFQSTPLPFCEMASSGARSTNTLRRAFAHSFLSGRWLTRAVHIPSSSNTHYFLRSSPSFSLHLSSTMRSFSSSSPTDATNNNGVKEEREWSNYEKLVRKLYMTNLFNPVKLGLENMDKLHKAIGSPMDKPNISVIHIAGSNGKGKKILFVLIVSPLPQTLTCTCSFAMKDLSR